METIFVIIPFGNKFRSIDLSQIIEGLEMAKASWRKQDLVGPEDWIVFGEKEKREEVYAISTK